MTLAEPQTWPRYFYYIRRKKIRNKIKIRDAQFIAGGN